MAHYGKRSLDRLATCDIRLRMVFHRVIQFYDVQILWGHRNEAEQNEAFDCKASKKRWPDSKHNSQPSKGIDAVPYPIDWEDRERFFYLAGIVRAVAASMGIELRWGGDWDSDEDFKDQTFNDLGHWEIV